VVLVAGTRDDADGLRDEVSTVLGMMGPRLSNETTRVCHLDEGFDFLASSRAMKLIHPLDLDDRDLIQSEYAHLPFVV